MSSIKLFCAITVNNGERVPIEISVESSATQLRQEVSNATRIPLSDLRLIFRGKMIKDDSSPAVTTYQLEDSDVLHCMGKPASGQVVPPPAVAAAVASNPIAAASAAVPTIPSAALPIASPNPTVHPLQGALTTLRTSNPPPVYSTAVSTLATVLSNIADHPMEEKYRKVKKGNVAFNKKLGGLNGGEAAMKAVGFVVEVQDGTEFYVMHASADAWPKLMECKSMVDAASEEAQRSLNAPTPNHGGMNPFFPTAAAGSTNNPMMPGMMNNAMMQEAMNNPAMMQGAMTEMMRNPEMLRQMLQNPMVQQMIQNDPNIPPMQRNMMQQLANNPAMLDQLSTMMSNPAAMARMQAMMSAGGGVPGMPPRMPANPPQASETNGNNNNMASNANRAAGNDQELTEEEMIAEAIRRSLQDN